MDDVNDEECNILCVFNNIVATASQQDEVVWLWL